MAMSAKKYLSQARWLKKEIDHKHERIMELRAMAERTTGNREALRISGTPSHSKLEDATMRLIEIENELAAVIDEYTAKYREISAVIDAVENPAYRDLLSLRYLSFMTWEDIAVKMRYSWRHTLRLHGEALLIATIPEK